VAFVSNRYVIHNGSPCVARVPVCSDSSTNVRSPDVLSATDIERFHHDGFLVIDRPIVEGDDLDTVRRYLEDLFRRFDELPRDWAYDLGDVQIHDGPQQIPEVNLATKFEPRLLDTVAYRRCLGIARELIGAKARPVYDHAILKPPHNQTATPWHQDLATAPQLEGHAAVHLWLALQDVTEANGCMEFVPSRGDQRLRPHRRRSDAAHALVAEGVDDRDAVVCPIRGGMATVHNLTTLHRTGPNTTDQPRFAWILHFRVAPPDQPARRARRALSRLARAAAPSRRVM